MVKKEFIIKPKIETKKLKEPYKYMTEYVQQPQNDVKIPIKES